MEFLFLLVNILSNSFSCITRQNTSIRPLISRKGATTTYNIETASYIFYHVVGYTQYIYRLEQYCLCKGKGKKNIILFLLKTFRIFYREKFVKFLWLNPLFWYKVKYFYCLISKQ